jgi:hypothetical protein
VLIVGAGLWHLATKMDFDKIEKLFAAVQKNLETRSELVILQLQTKSISYDHGVYNDTDVDKLNAVFRSVFQNSSTILFDSHLQIYNEYSKICGTFFDHLLKAPPSSMWHCKDPNHSPFLLTKHYLKLILLQMCTL